MKHSIVLAGLASSTLLTLSAAQAQSTTAEQTAAPVAALEEIVVTAQKRAQSLGDVPIAVTALTANDLRNANIDAQTALPLITPNLSFVTAASLSSPFLRGVGTNFAITGLDPSVPVYLNDTYLPRGVSAFFSLNDVERGEVLKGPQGTLYGRNASGGAIRIITFDPKDKFEAAASATFGSFDRKAADIMLNVPLSDSVAFRIAARHDENDGYVRNLNAAAAGLPSKIFRKGQNTVLAKLLVKATDALTVKLDLDFANQNGNESVGYPNVFPSGPEQVGAAVGGCAGKGFYEACINTNPLLGIRQYGGSARIDYNFGPLTLSSITASRRATDQERVDVDATGAPLIFGTGRPGDGEFSHTNQFTQELQVTSNGNDRFSYVAGVYYFAEKSGVLNSLTGAGLPFPTGTGFVDSAAVNAHSIAAYAQADIAMGEKFTVTLGGRYTDETKRLMFNTFGLGAADGLGGAYPDVPLFTEGGRVVSFNKFTPKFTLTYRPSHGVMMYGTYSVGFKSGGFNLPQYSASDAVQPEVLTNIEIGAKVERESWRFAASAFNYNFKDRQVQSVDENDINRTSNAAEARIRGLEADVTWVPSQGLEIGAGIGYIHARYREYLNGQAAVPCADVAALSASSAAEAAGKATAEAACAAGFGLGMALVGARDLSGKNLEVTPSFTGYTRAAYTIPMHSAGDFTISGIVNYRSKAYFDAANLYADPSRVMLSARLGWVAANGKLNASVFGDNLTNRQYNNQVIIQAFGGIRVPAPPRTYNVQIGYRF